MVGVRNHRKRDRASRDEDHLFQFRWRWCTHTERRKWRGSRRESTGKLHVKSTKKPKGVTSLASRIGLSLARGDQQVLFNPPSTLAETVKVGRRKRKEYSPLGGSQNTLTRRRGRPLLTATPRDVLKKKTPSRKGRRTAQNRAGGKGPKHREQNEKPRFLGLAGRDVNGGKPHK